MGNIIDDLYFGEIPPSTTTVLDQKLEKDNKTIEAALLGILNEDEKRLFNKYMNNQSTLMGDTAVKNFRKGFIKGLEFYLAVLKS